MKVHLKSILKKTDAGNRTQAAIWALKRSSDLDGARPSGLTPQLAAQ